MAATGYTPISLYYSTTASAVPVNTNLANGELAINITDGKLYYKDNGGTVRLLASNATSAPVLTFQTSLSGLTPSTATSGAITLAGTLGVASGGTGLTTLTAGYIPYGNGTGAFSSLSTFNFSGTQLSIGSASALLPGGSPSTRGEVSINGSTDSFVAFGIGGTIAGYVGQTSNGLQLDSEGATTITMVTNGAERLRITSAGLVCINGTSGTALLTVASSTTYPALKVPNIVETANTVAGAPASTQTFYLASGAVQYYTSNAANNWTVNFAMSAGTSMNTAMAVGDSVSVTMLTTQGSTAYYNSAVQIDGASVTPKWQGGTAPTSGNASGIDSYTYVIYKTASATYTVLASQTKFA